METVYLRVALDYPLTTLFDYRCNTKFFPLPGTLVQVPFGKRSVVGIVYEVTTHTDVPKNKLRKVDKICIDLPPLSQKWFELISFSADYYQRSFGEVGLSAIPYLLRDPSMWDRLFTPERVYKLTDDGRAALLKLPARSTALLRLSKALYDTDLLSLSDARILHPKATQTLDKWTSHGWLLSKDINPWTSVSQRFSYPKSTCISSKKNIDNLSKSFENINTLQLTEEQIKALTAIVSANGFSPFLLYGVTGSGKTEVYLNTIAARLKEFEGAQALILIPEINLTPQFESIFHERFSKIFKTENSIVTLHSGLSKNIRVRNWLAAHTGHARIVLGTRLAVLASLPSLAVIIVDEEHESGYKQQEKLRYSARDLAVWRAKQLRIPIILGSATPSLESWWKAEQGHYSVLTLSRRTTENSVLPKVRLVNLEEESQFGRRSVGGLSETLLSAIKARLVRGEQSLIFLNRRGYAPVLVCHSCGWIAVCSGCSAYVVLHKQDHILRCHHCGLEKCVYRSCPECMSIDLSPLGQGTQRVEETLARLIPNARVLRIDADSTRCKNRAKTLFSNVHSGEVDILVGTQMIAKGHDFRRISLVGVLNADTALFSHDFRASERLFAQLIQVSGRAGRSGLSSDVLIQTRYPWHALYLALKQYNYIKFANAILSERREANLPPFIYQALLRTEARTLDAALLFLRQASKILSSLPDGDQVMVYDAVPMRIVKIANLHRAQLLFESSSRIKLQCALRNLKIKLMNLSGVLRWHIDVDPLDI